MKEFITTWKTDNNGASCDNQIVIGTQGDGYDYTIDWGDGQIDYNVTGDETHTYEFVGTYGVTISGAFPRLYFYANGYDNDKLLSVEQWGGIKWQSMDQMFSLCGNLVINATDTPDLSCVTSMILMFYGASAFNQDISHWDVSSVKNMNGMFNRAHAFNQDISHWDVSAVTDMNSMFYRAHAFNQDISHWDVSAVTDMNSMFYRAHAFNQDISDWDVSKVTDMRGMFSRAEVFNLDISRWNVSARTGTDGMFNRASAFNQANRCWDVVDG